MNLKHPDVLLGIGTMLFGLLLLTYGIPTYVSSPSNVPKIVLSPTFWPDIIAYLVMLLGLVLTLSRALGTVQSGTSQHSTKDLETPMQPWLRLVAIAVVMTGLVIAIPDLGMVWSSMLAFIAISAIVRTPKPVTSLIVAIALPLVLYGFFNHVAGVAVPQGRFISLP